MKIIYLAAIRLPTEKAHGIQIMKTCEALAAQGVDVELVVPKRKNHLVGDPFDFYTVKKTNNFKLQFVRCIDAIGWPIGKLGFWITTRSFYRNARKYLSSDSVCYTRDLPLALSLLKDHRRFVYEIHNLPETPSRWHKEVWQRALGLVVISGGIKSQLVAWGVPEARIQIAHDAVDIGQFRISEHKQACREKLSVPLDDAVVVYTGHLYEWKGAGVLAEAASLLGTGVQVYMVGGTDHDVASFKARYSVSNLHIMGRRPHEEMPYWDKAADVLVLPTSGRQKIGAEYTSPMKAFEYVASGTPIVASRIPSLQEIFNNEDVVFFEADSAADLARAIQVALQNPPQIKERRDFSWVERAKKITSFIQGITALKS